MGFEKAKEIILEAHFPYLSVGLKKLSVLVLPPRLSSVIFKIYGAFLKRWRQAPFWDIYSIISPHFLYTFKEF